MTDTFYLSEEEGSIWRENPREPLDEDEVVRLLNDQLDELARYRAAFAWIEKNEPRVVFGIRANKVHLFYHWIQGEDEKVIIADTLIEAVEAAMKQTKENHLT